MKSILVATDFSPAAYNAAEYATELAKTLQAEIVLLHVFQVPVSISEIPITADIGDILKDAEKEMESLQKILAIKAGENVNFKRKVVIGVFFNELKNMCELVNPYAVVMGSQGTSAAERFLFGGHTIYAMRHLKWPLITVPVGAKFSVVQKIGLACNPEYALELLPAVEVKELVKDLNAELQVLNIKIGPDNPEVSYKATLLEKSLKNLMLDFQFHTISSEDIDEGILDFSEKNKLDLLIVLPRRHGLIDKLLHKSHAKNLIMHSHIPVMTLHS